MKIDHGAIHYGERYDGKRVLETNDDTISLEDASCGYKGLMILERCSRALKKTRIKISPLYHWAPRRIRKNLCPRLADRASGKAALGTAMEQNWVRAARATNFLFFYAPTPLLQA